MHYTYYPRNVCSSKIDFDLVDGTVRNISFVGGCNGNLKALSKVLDGWTVDQIAEKLEGNTCGGKPTSCADQLVRAVKAAREQAKNNA